MAGDQNYGATAFPVTAENGLGHIADGMSLRDWFAGQALISTYLNGYAGPSPKLRAETCYAMADAMLLERQKP